MQINSTFMILVIANKSQGRSWQKIPWRAKSKSAAKDN